MTSIDCWQQRNANVMQNFGHFIFLPSNEETQRKRNNERISLCEFAQDADTIPTAVLTNRLGCARLYT